MPEFIQYFANQGMKVYIEEGYGARSGYTYEDYKRASLNTHLCSREEAFQKDVSIILRSPKLEEFDLVKPGSTLISMLHYHTRSTRLAHCKNVVSSPFRSTASSMTAVSVWWKT